MRYIEVKAHAARQGSRTIYSFVVESDVLDAIAFVSRRDDDKDAGYQRNLSRQRAADIAHYLDDDDGCLPVGVLLSLESGAAYDRKRGVLRIPNKPRSAWVIDGQHRLYGLRLAKTKFQLPVTAFLGLNVTDQAKLFVTINSKQKGVSTSLLYDLLDLTKDGTFLESRAHALAVRLNEDPQSPWYELIDMTGSGAGLITQTRVVTALQGLISERGCLYQYSEEEQFGILRNYFMATRTLLASDWGNKRSVLTKAMGFSAMVLLLPQVLPQTIQQCGDFKVDSVSRVLDPLRSYNFSADEHKGWAGHPGENRLAAALASKLRAARSEGAGSSQPLRLA